MVGLKPRVLLAIKEAWPNILPVLDAVEAFKGLCLLDTDCDNWGPISITLVRVARTMTYRCVIRFEHILRGELFIFDLFLLVALVITLAVRLKAFRQLG